MKAYWDALFNYEVLNFVMEDEERLKACNKYIFVKSLKIPKPKYSKTTGTQI